MAANTQRRVTVLTHFPVERLDRVRARVPEADLVAIPSQGDVPAEARGEIVLTLPWGTPNLPAVIERGVRWIHTVGTGVDGFPLAAVGDRILTCSRGASAVPIAEWILAMMLAFEKRLPETWITAPPERWSSADLGGLAGRCVALVGVGAIGTAVAVRALPFGARVRALRRTGRAAPLPEIELAPSLADLAASADHLVVAAPLTEETRGMIDRAALAHLKPGAHVINVSRGSLVDQDALREALDDGRIARASLDTVTPEPLPAGHWLYAHPRVRLSPHVSWSAPSALDVFFDMFADNLRRYLDGAPLHGVVDVAAGY